MSTPAPLVIATANVRGNPPMLQSRVRHDFRLVAGLDPDLVAWQELWWPRYRRSLRKNLTAFNHHAPNSLAGSCTSYRRNRLAFVSAGADRLHRGIATLTGHRDITWTRHVDKVTGVQLTHASTHFVPGAWTYPARSRAQDRMELWQTGITNLRHFLAHEIKAGQGAVIVGMDGNAPRPVIVGALGSVIESAPVRVLSHGIDHLVVVGRADVIETAQPVPHAYSDHAPVVASVLLRGPLNAR